MRQVETVAALRAALRDAPRPVGLAPTMGALHDGHLALVRAARSECATVAATIFVNPTQFGPNEDLDRYPRSLAADLALLEREDVDCVFTPSVDEMYPAGFTTTVHMDGPALPLEGAARPGHFDGVATVVAKLLLQSLPDRAYLGRKDGQQTAVVRRLVRDLDIPVEIVVVPTVREADGLAMSSRNAYLTPEQRAAAPVVFRALSASRDRFRAGQQDVAALEDAARRMIEASPLASVEYVAGVDPDTMAPWGGLGPCMLAAAVRIGGVRLIDNVILD
ncbi:MAG: pantoate--beta-alanine ligase [Chloroflexi bacterium]|nr:pantoate--beta-alanine ligase [Chloroflexota bacterium]MYF64515.1 pantoate--beta-alanine ligase [Chloroflexota bacterium]MYK36016.1 pantoate--beta-alanine ligase [Chloroflexota bacterium]